MLAVMEVIGEVSRVERQSHEREILRIRRYGMVRQVVRKIFQIIEIRDPQDELVKSVQDLFHFVYEQQKQKE